MARAHRAQERLPRPRRDRAARPAAPSTGQISFANKNVRVGDAYKGKAVALRCDPADRQVVIHACGAALGALGPEIRRFACPAFDRAAILGTATVAGYQEGPAA